MNRNRSLFIGLTAGLLSLSPCLHAQTPTNPPTTFVVVLATDPVALEGTSSGAFTLIRNGDSTKDLTVDLKISGSASNGVDYTTISNEVTIPAGSLAVDILVQPIVDTAKRGNKTVVLGVDTNADYSVSGDRHATVTIVDDVFNTPPPTVSLTSPTNGSIFAAPAMITLEAEANDPKAPITSVSFYANDDFLGKVASSPYTFVWSNAPAGHFSLFARAVDSVGQSMLSTPVQITVTNPPLPTVTLTSPTNGQNFTAHQDITLKADASDTDDAVASVSFYANGHFLGSTTNSPYSIVWSNAPSGFYLLRAAAMDQNGDKGYSHPVFINVTRLP